MGGSYVFLRGHWKSWILDSRFRGNDKKEGALGAFFAFLFVFYSYVGAIGGWFGRCVELLLLGDY